MRRSVLLVLAFVIVVVIVTWFAIPAHATPIHGGLDYTAARGNTVEHFDLGWRLEAGGFLQIDRWHATASFAGLMSVHSDLPERDGTRLGAWSAGGRLAYHHPLAHHAVAMIALGFERIWLRGEDDVRRGCRETGACLIGYFTEQPHYDAWAPQLRIGYGLFAPAPDTKLGGTLELIVEPMFYSNVPPDGAHGIAVFAAFTGTVGGGRGD